MPVNSLTQLDQNVFQESRRLTWNTKTATGTPAAGAAGVYSTKAILVPKFAILLNVIVHAVALWNADTSATGKVGDDVDDDRYFTGIDMKATDLLAGEGISFFDHGGKAGADIVGTLPTGHWENRYSTLQRQIKLIVTTVGAAATTGETILTVVYAWSPPSRAITGGIFVPA